MLHRSLCALYRLLLYSYPAQFRRRFGPEMEQVFEARCHAVLETCGLRGLARFVLETLADWLVSTLRETAAAPAAMAAAAPPSDHVPAFHTIEEHAPPTTALITGGLLSIVLFTSAALAIQHSGARSLYSFFGLSHRPHILEANWPPLLTLPVASALPSSQKSLAVRPGVLDALLALFDHTNLVALGEIPGTREDSDLRIRLIHHPEFPSKTQIIVVEFASALHQDTLDRYLKGEDVPTPELQKIWRDLTTPGAADSPVYAQFFAEVRSVNRGLPDALKIRILAAGPPIDWNAIHRPGDWRKIASTRDAFAAGLINREVLNKGQKALLIFNARRPWLDLTHRVYSVMPIPGGVYPDTPKIEQAIGLTDYPAFLPLRGTALTLAQVADACIYRGRTPDTQVNPDPHSASDPAYIAEKARRLALTRP